MVRVCTGQTGALGQTGHLLHASQHGKHAVYDVTIPASPMRLSVIAPPTGVFSATHGTGRCDTGIAYLVAGANAQVDESRRLDDEPARQVPTLAKSRESAVRPRHRPRRPESEFVEYVPGDVGRSRAHFRSQRPDHRTTSQSNLHSLRDVVERRDADRGPAQGASRQPGRLMGRGTQPQNPTDDDLRGLVVGSMDMTPTEGAVARRSRSSEYPLRITGIHE